MDSMPLGEVEVTRVVEIPRLHMDRATTYPNCARQLWQTTRIRCFGTSGTPSPMPC